MVKVTIEKYSADSNSSNAPTDINVRAHIAALNERPKINHKVVPMSAREFLINSGGVANHLPTFVNAAIAVEITRTCMPSVMAISNAPSNS